MIEKIFYFFHAKSIVGLIGGGMCNLLFSPSTTKSTVICSPLFLEINNRFKYCMEHTNIQFVTSTEIIFERHPYAKYQRIKILSGKFKDMYAEITAAKLNPTSNQIDLTCMLGDTTSVSILCSDNKITISSANVELIDQGLNSPFSLDMTSIYGLKQWLE
jgi:hypothetical protein